MLIDLKPYALSLTLLPSPLSSKITSALGVKDKHVICPALTVKSNKIITVERLMPGGINEKEIVPSYGLFIPKIFVSGKEVDAIKVSLSKLPSSDAILTMPFTDGEKRFMKIVYLDKKRKILGVVPACYVVDEELNIYVSIAPPLPTFLFHDAKAQFDDDDAKGFVNIVPHEIFTTLAKGNLKWKSVEMMNTQDDALAFVFSDNNVGMVAINEEELARIDEPKEIKIWKYAIERKLPLGYFGLIRKGTRYEKTLPNALI